MPNTTNTVAKLLLSCLVMCQCSSICREQIFYEIQIHLVSDFKNVYRKLYNDFLNIKDLIKRSLQVFFGCLAEKSHNQVIRLSWFP